MRAPIVLEAMVGVSYDSQVSDASEQCSVGLRVTALVTRAVPRPHSPASGVSSKTTPVGALPEVAVFG